ncbi:MAG: hypothetical protein N2691_02025 [Patescibacteria group bacterium]|nr:hypothetical protein [Patescibacteria group bacterium]
MVKNIASCMNRLRHFSLTARPIKILFVALALSIGLALPFTQEIPTSFQIKNLTDDNWVKGVDRLMTKVLIETTQKWHLALLHRSPEVVFTNGPKGVITQLEETPLGTAVTLYMYDRATNKEIAGYPNALQLRNLKTYPL